MTQTQVVQAWKDPMFRGELNAAQLKAMPANPAGMVELEEGELTELSGGTGIPCSIMFAIILLIS